MPLTQMKKHQGFGSWLFWFCFGGLFLGGGVVSCLAFLAEETVTYFKYRFRFIHFVFPVTYKANVLALCYIMQNIALLY